MSSKINVGRLKEDRKRDTFEFIIPEIPPLKSGKNIIPTGKQIPRTPIKPEVTVTKPSESSDDLEQCIANDEPTLKNMIPKGREIPRTPPNYGNIPFLMSGCHVREPPSFLQPIDLGVKPLEDMDDLEDIAINEENITVRKRPMPKEYNVDLALEMLEAVNLEDVIKGLAPEESQKKSTKLCDPAVTDNEAQNHEASEQKNQQDVSLSNIGIAGKYVKNDTEQQDCLGVNKSIVKDTIMVDRESVVKKKIVRQRAAPKKSSVLSKQEGKDNDGASKGNKAGRCRSLLSAGVGENNSKDSVKPHGCMNVGESILEEINCQNGEVTAEKKKGRMRGVSKGSSLASNLDKECRGSGVESKVDMNQENIFLVKKEAGKSLQPSERGKKRSDNREKCSLPSNFQIRRNPSRRAKEGVDYLQFQE